MNYMKTLKRSLLMILTATALSLNAAGASTSLLENQSKAIDTTTISRSPSPLQETGDLEEINTLDPRANQFENLQKMADETFPTSNLEKEIALRKERKDRISATIDDMVARQKKINRFIFGEDMSKEATNQ